MTKELLQSILDEKEIKVKVLLVRKTELSDYEVVFTRDLDYFVSEEEVIKRDGITEPEEDVLVDDLDEAVFEIKYQLSKKAWYE